MTKSWTKTFLGWANLINERTNSSEGMTKYKVKTILMSSNNLTFTIVFAIVYIFTIKILQSTTIFLKVSNKLFQCVLTFIRLLNLFIFMIFVGSNKPKMTF